MRKRYILGSGFYFQAAPDVVRVDILPHRNVDLVHDLDVAPWPIPDGAALHCNASHIIEHLKNPVSFMDECWRILNPGGTLLLKTPDAADLDMAWADPTHKRPFRIHSFINYFTLEGVKKFGYAKHAWSLLYVKTDGKEIILHAMPIPDEIRNDEILNKLSEGKKV